MICFEVHNFNFMSSFLKQKAREPVDCDSQVYVRVYNGVKIMAVACTYLV